MTKRNMWSYDETLEMLNIMLQQESLKAMNGRPFRKDKAFRLVCEEMMHRGYNTKDPKQIENRWKNLKKRYVDIQKEPFLAESNPFQFYDEIDVLMKGKPPQPPVPPPSPPSSPPVVTEPKLYTLSISRVDSKPDMDTEEALDEPEQLLQEDGEDEIIKNEEIDKNPVVETMPQCANISPRRSKRHRKRPTPYRRNETLRPCFPSYKLATEEEAYRNQKKLIDYQFGLYSKAQEESDQKFLNMSRQILDECNQKFQSFLDKFVSGSVSGT